MANRPQKGRSVHGFYDPIHGDCAIYFDPGVSYITITLPQTNSLPFEK